MPPRSYRDVVPFRIREDLNRAGDIKNRTGSGPTITNLRRPVVRSHTETQHSVTAIFTEQTSGNRELKLIAWRKNTYWKPALVRCPKLPYSCRGACPAQRLQ
jgi:hypothetical protein